MPPRLAKLSVDLRLRVAPSGEHGRRQLEMRRANVALKGSTRLSRLPPVLIYGDEDQIAPHRVQPLLDGLEEPEERISAILHVPMVQPRLPALDREDLRSDRPLLPRRFRRTLGRAPHSRAAALLTLGAISLVAGLWISQVHGADAVAASRFHHARHVFQQELAVARSDGVGRRSLLPVLQRSAVLATMQEPSSLFPLQSHVRFYQQGERRYAALLRSLRQLERRALRYWRSRAVESFRVLLGATAEAGRFGLSRSRPVPARCRTPGCYRRAVGTEMAASAWLRETAATLRTYGAAIAAAPDPSAAAAQEVQEAHNLGAMLPAPVALPLRLPNLDGALATAGSSAQVARTGALAHLDDDALLAHLVRELPRRAVLISTEDQTLICYAQARRVCHAPVVAGPQVPLGIYHLEGKQRVAPALLWNTERKSAPYRSGSLFDWMPFSDRTALQGAPWRSQFGPGAASPLYAPDTPSSVDLPPAVADRLFHWAPLGTAIYLY